MTAAPPRDHAPGDPPADPRPQPPEAPLPSDCCESGCEPCVYDLHAEAMDDYRHRLAAWLTRHSPGT